MKKNFFFSFLATLVLTLAILLPAACSNSSGGGDSEQIDPPLSITMIENSTKSITLSVGAGKKIYLAKYNLNAVATPSNDIRVLESAEGLASESNVSTNVAASVDNGLFEETASGEKYPRSLLWAWKPDSQKRLSFSNSKSLGISASLTPDPLTNDKVQITPVAGTTTKDFFLPINDNNDKTVYFYPMTFVARAVGKHCIVWAPAETQSVAASTAQTNIPTNHKNLIKLPDRSAGNTTFTDDMANELRDKFEAAYPYETEMFGDKTQYIYSTHDYENKTKVNIKKISDTAQYTNIIVYDFKNSSNDTNAVGYFWNKDYRPNYKTLYGNDYPGTIDKPQLANPDDIDFYYYSNEGNVIYITIKDIIFESDDDKAKKTWVETNENGGKTIVCNPDSYLTLCHEYMHSLQYGRKCIEQGFGNWTTALGETLGTLCEDVMKDVLGVPKSYSVENYRLAEFCHEHYFSSVMDDNRNLSYANLLAFGIFLTRNYGGAKLVGDMVKNKDSGDWSCITTAIKNVTGKNKTPDRLMKEFLEQLLKSNSAYTSNKNSASMTVEGVDFTMKAINMKDLSEWFGYELAKVPSSSDYYQQVKKGVKTYDAKNIIRKKTVAGDDVYDIRPRGGFNLHYIGTAQSDQVTLVFSDAYAGANHPKMMVIVGD